MTYKHIYSNILASAALELHTQLLFDEETAFLCTKFEMLFGKDEKLQIDTCVCVCVLNASHVHWVHTKFISLLNLSFNIAKTMV